MKINLGDTWKLGILFVGFFFWAGVSVNATNVINSKGFPPLTTISLNGINDEPPWASAFPATTIAGSVPGSLTVIHTQDSIYFLAVINDTVFAPTDAFTLRFAVGADCTSDFGVVVPRSAAAGGTPTWGLDCQNEQGWSSVPITNFGVVDNGNNWVVEFKVPLDLSVAVPNGPKISLTQALGFAFAFCDGNTFGCAYNPWPAGASIHDPTTWGQLVFDPKTTFPDLSVVSAQTNHTNPDQIYRNRANSFSVQVNNPGGTAIPDAQNVRINLYLSARGIGEPWHRFDDTPTLTTECTNGNPSIAVISLDQICQADKTPLPDIELTTISDVVNNVAKYTIRNGVGRTGGSSITVAAGAQPTVPIVDWTLTGGQTGFFVPVTVGTNSYDRSHDCLLAQVISPGDQNSGNDILQVNMDFITAVGGMKKALPMSVAPAGFKKYDPNVGKKMFLQVASRNMDQGFEFKLEGLHQLPSGLYEADLKGTASVPVSATIVAPPPDTQGKTIKENLVVPPRAGEDAREVHHWCPFRRASDQPVHVQVTPGSTLWIVNYALNDNDIQFVDVDGSGPLPPNGPEGLPSALVTGSHGHLLVPNAHLGELVLSFDNFKHGVGIGDGVQVQVPAGANYLSLAINDSHEGYDKHKGTGFRVKIIDKSSVPAAKMAVQARAATEEVIVEGGGRVIPINKVLPQTCVNGYEDLGDKIFVNGKELELFGYIGNVCWQVNAILRGEGPPIQEKGDKPAPKNPAQ